MRTLLAWVLRRLGDDVGARAVLGHVSKDGLRQATFRAWLEARDRETRMPMSELEQVLRRAGERRRRLIARPSRGLVRFRGRVGDR